MAVVTTTDAATDVPTLATPHGVAPDPAPPDAPAAPPGRRRMAGEQLLGSAGQIAAGVGNLAFSLVMVRVLRPGDFAVLATFLALYLLLHTPASSLAAGTAVDPRTVARWSRVVVPVGVLLAVGGIVASEQLGRLIGLPQPLVVVLAAAAPTAGVIALLRGWLFGTGRTLGAVGTLLTEPLVRLGLGVWLTLLVGVEGAAVAVVAAGYVAVAAALVAGTRPARLSPSTVTWRRSTSLATVIVFVLLAIVQTQDVVLAHRLLSAPEAARFAAVSTLGGIALFATATVPLVLLPRVARAHRGALTVASAIAATLGAAAVVAAAVVPARLVIAVFGPDYRGVPELLVPYLGAMALFGLARVLLAAGCARGRRLVAIAVAAAGAAVQSVLIVTWAHDAADVAKATAAGCTLLTVGALVGTRLPTTTAVRRRLAVLATPTALAIGGLTVLAVALRLMVTRSIWVDEAISVSEARQSFPGMIHALTHGDVHPPFYFTVLWAVIHATGSTAELVVRAPSIVAGTLLVPVVYAAARDIYDRRTGLVAAAFTATGPVVVWYSQEARMYAFFMLFTVLAAWAAVRTLRGGGVLAWSALTVASAAAVWTQYFAALPVAVGYVALLAVAVHRRRRGGGRLLAKTSASALGLVLLLLPLWPYLHEQLWWYTHRSTTASLPAQTGQSASSTGGIGVYAVLANLIWALWGYHSDATMVLITALWPLLILAALVLLGRGRSTPTAVLVALVVAPVAVLYAVGTHKRDLFELRYFIGAVPALLMLLARAVTRIGRRGVAVAAGAALLLTTFGVGLFDQQANSANPRLYDFRGAFTALEQRARPGDRVLFAPEFLTAEVGYYAPSLHARPLDASNLPRPEPGGRVFVLASFLDQRRTAAEVGAALSTLRRQGQLVKTIKRANVEVWEFTS